MSHTQSILTCVLLRVESIFLDMLFCYLPIVEQHNLPFHLSIHCLQLLCLYVCILHNSDVCLINISFEIVHVQIVVNIIRYVIPYSDKSISVTPSAFIFINASRLPLLTSQACQANSSTQYRLRATLFYIKCRRGLFP